MRRVPRKLLNKIRKIPYWIRNKRSEIIATVCLDRVKRIKTDGKKRPDIRVDNDQHGVWYFSIFEENEIFQFKFILHANFNILSFLHNVYI